MKNIKTIDQFLLEALRDDWRESIELTPLQKKYFGMGYSDEIIEDVLKDIAKHLVEQSDDSLLDNFMDGVRMCFYDDNHKDEEWDVFWENGKYNISFLNHVEKIVNDRCQDVIKIIKNNKFINIYRAIKVNQVWLDLFLNKENDEVHLGKYWTYIEGNTEPYWGGNKKQHLIDFKCLVDTEYINLINTFFQNIVEYDEDEIQLFPNTPLELISITIDGKEVDLSNFKNKEIYA
jgi:hypothetical protein